MENIDAIRKDLKSFTNKFIFSTETVSFAIIIPLLLLYAGINFNLNQEQTIMLLKYSGIAIVIALISTNIVDRKLVAPIARYFNSLLKGEPVPEEVYAAAQKRFFSLPYYHSTSSFIHWIFGLSIAIVPIIFLGELTPTQTINCIMIFAVIPPLGSMLFFFLTEIFLQRLLNKGMFNRIVLKEFKLSMRFRARLFYANILICVLPVIGIIGFYSIIIEFARIDSAVSYLRLGGIVLFGLIVALSVSMTLSRTVMDKINLISNFLTRIGAGDLSARKGIIAVNDELTRINQTIYIMKKNITAMMTDINSISAKMDASTHEISSITQSFTEVTQSQAATVEEVTATIVEITAGMDRIADGAQGQVRSLMSLIDRMDELSGTVRELSQNISTASELAAGITAEARSGEESLRRMNQSMLNISASSQEMTGIVGIITDISDKINLLSLNASIEAARAGESGRGFAVVADEISKLADSTASSVKNIDSLIKTTDDEIRNGLTGVTDVVARIGKIAAGIGAVSGMVEKIAGIMQKQVDTNAMVGMEAASVKQKSQEIETSTREQKLAISEVADSMTRINDLTQTISAGSEEITANTTENAKIAEVLKQKVDQFKLA